MDWTHLLTSFDGRINRGRFWAGMALLVAIGIVANIVDGMSGFRLAGPESMGLVSLITWLLSLYAALAIYAKRWHDRGKSGWWSLIILVPLVGPVWALLELGFLEGSPDINSYGPNPLG